MVNRLCMAGLALLVSWLLVGAHVHAADGATQTLAEYEQTLRAALIALDANSDPQVALAEAKAMIDAVTVVRLPSGGEVMVQPLLANVEDLLTARARLSVVQEQIALSVGDNSVARLAVLEAVLARAEFNQPEPLWERIVRWLRDLLARWFPDQQSDALTEPISDRLITLMGWVVIGMACLVLVVVLSYWLQALISGMVRDVTLHRRRQNGEEEPLSAAEARQRATTLAQLGNYRQAVRQLYLSALLTLEEQRLLVVNRSLTNREVLASVAGATHLSTHLEPVVRVFDDVWYGVHEPDAATFTAYAAEIDQLNNLAGQSKKESA